jgi:hypothetical protein
MSTQDLKDEKIQILVSRIIAGEPVYYQTGIPGITKLGKKRIWMTDALHKILDDACDDPSGEEYEKMSEMVCDAANGNRTVLFDKINDVLGGIVEDRFDDIVEYEREKAR